MHRHWQKWLTIVLMLIVTAGTVYGTVFFRPELAELGRSYGPAGRSPQIYLWGAEIAVCLAVWGATYLVCAAIQRTMDVWQGFNLLPVLLLAVIVVNFAPQLGRRIGLEIPDYTAWKTPQMLQKEYVAQVIMNNNACQAAFDRVGFPKFMRPVSLGAERGVGKARELLEQTRAVEQSCAQRDKAQTAKFRTDVDALHFRAKARQEALATLEAGADSAEADRIHLRRIETDLIAAYGRMLTDLAASKAGWYADGYDIAFYSKHELKLFHTHVVEVAKLTKERNDVTERLWARTATGDKPDAP